MSSKSAMQPQGSMSSPSSFLPDSNEIPNKEAHSRTSVPTTGLGDMMHALGIATEGYRYMEEIGQHRLHNFLVGDTILLLGWATLLEVGARNEASLTRDRALVLVALAILSTVLSILWTILGLRERKFLDLQMNIVCTLEDRLVDRFGDENLRITRPIRQLQRGDAVDERFCGEGAPKLTWAEKKLKSRNLAVFAPLAFGIASLVLVITSFIHLIAAKS